MLNQWFLGAFTYDLDVARDGGATSVVQFVTETRRGYCEQFATAYATMARLLGIPSRVVVGFARGEQQADGTEVVQGRHAHAWVEIYAPGTPGWVTVDATPGQGLNSNAPRPADVTPTTAPRRRSRPPPPCRPRPRRPSSPMLRRRRAPRCPRRCAPPSSQHCCSAGGWPPPPAAGRCCGPDAAPPASAPTSSSSGPGAASRTPWRGPARPRVRTSRPWRGPAAAAGTAHSPSPARARSCSPRRR